MKIKVLGLGYRGDCAEVFAALELGRRGVFDALGQEFPRNLSCIGGFPRVDKILGGVPYIPNLHTYISVLDMVYPSCLPTDIKLVARYHAGPKGIQRTGLRGKSAIEFRNELAAVIRSLNCPFRRRTNNSACSEESP